MANYFDYGDLRFSPLDMSVERDAPTQHAEPYIPFPERAAKYLKKASEDKLKHKFINVYSYCAEMYTAIDPSVVSRLSLTGQTTVYSAFLKRLTLCARAAVFYNNGKKFKPLYEIRHFENKAEPTFLSKEKLLERLSPLFKSIKISLGKLTEKGIPSIAWQLQTNEGIFYIPWHNGCIMESSEDTSFEEHSFIELKKSNIYACLRFGESLTSHGESYRIVCC